MNKDLEKIKDRIQTIIHQEYLHVTGAAYLEEILSSAERMAEEIARLKAELEKYKGDNMNKCPDGIIRECCYDVNEHKFKPEGNITVTNEACGVCIALKEKIEYWKKQFDLEVAGRRIAEAELDKAKQTEHSLYQQNSQMNKVLMDIEKTDGGKGENYRLKKQISELEKRPEVVRCGMCISCQSEYSQDEDGRIIAELLVCGMSGRPINENDFCSLGQRRESEEKN